MKIYVVFHGPYGEVRIELDYTQVLVELVAMALKEKPILVPEFKWESANIVMEPVL